MANKLQGYIKQSYAGIIIGVFFYLLYLYFTFSGNRICDCETTEKYNSSSSTRTHGAIGVTHFYHK